MTYQHTRITRIGTILRKKGRLLFSALVAGRPGRRFLVVTLVALLEMARRGEIIVEQDDLFSEVWIARRRGRRAQAARSKTAGGNSRSSGAEK